MSCSLSVGAKEEIEELRKQLRSSVVAAAVAQTLQQQQQQQQDPAVGPAKDNLRIQIQMLEASKCELERELRDSNSRAAAAESKLRQQMEAMALKAATDFLPERDETILRYEKQF